MNKQKTQTLTTLLLTFTFTFSLLFTSLAASPGEGIIPKEETPEVSRGILLGVSPGEGIIPKEETSEASRVILLGASRSAAEAAGSTDESSANIATGQWKQGQSLGKFITTGYCNCSECSGGHFLTYSGTVPKANHTISADLNLFPLGTKLMINGVVYTVEDMGSSVDGRWLDVYYDDHGQAVAHGMKTEEVFAATESNTP